MGRKKKDPNTLDDKAKDKLTCELFNLMKAYVISKDGVPIGRPSHKKLKKRSTTKSENPVSKAQPVDPAKAKSRNKVFRKRNFQDSGQPVHRQKDKGLKRLDKISSISSWDNDVPNLRLTQSEVIQEALFRTRNDAMLIAKMAKVNFDVGRGTGVSTPKPFDFVGKNDGYGWPSTQSTGTRKNSGLPRPMPSRNMVEISPQTKSKPKFAGKRKRKLTTKWPITTPNSVCKISNPCRTFVSNFTQQDESFKPYRMKHEEIRKKILPPITYPPIMTCRKLPVPTPRRTLAEFGTQSYPVTERIQKYAATGDQLNPDACMSWQPLVTARAYLTGIGGHGTLRSIKPRPDSLFKVYDIPGMKPPELFSEADKPRDQFLGHCQDRSYVKPQRSELGPETLLVKAKLPELPLEIPRYKASLPKFVSSIHKVRYKSTEMVQDIPNVKAEVPEYIPDFSRLKDQTTKYCPDSARTQTPEHMPCISNSKPQTPEYLMTSRSRDQPPNFIQSIPELKTSSSEMIQNISTQKLCLSVAVTDSRPISAISSGGFTPSASISQVFKIDTSKAIPKEKRIPLAPSPAEINRSSRTNDKAGIFPSVPQKFEMINPRRYPYPIWCRRMDEPIKFEQTEEPDMLEHLDPAKTPKNVAHPRSGLTLPKASSKENLEPSPTPPKPSTPSAPPKLSLGQRFSQAILKLFPRKSPSQTPENESLTRPETATSKNAFGLMETIRLDIGITTEGKIPKPVLERSPSTGMILKRVYGVLDLTLDVTQKVRPTTNTTMGSISKKKSTAFRNVYFSTEKPVKRDQNHSRNLPREFTSIEVHTTDSSDSESSGFVGRDGREGF